MLKGYRGSLLALAASLLLLLAVFLTRPADTTTTTTPATSTSVPVPPTETAAPTLTPAPTIPFQQVDTATLNEALIGPECVTKLNPLLAGYNRADRDITSLIFEGLMTTDQRGAIIPRLAAAQPNVSQDGLLYVFKLRTDVKWQDGVQFSSDDVLFTIHLMQEDDFPGPADLRKFWQTVEVDALDAQTIRFKLAQPLATFTDYLRVGIVPEHALRNTAGEALSTHPFNLSPIGTGPYQFAGLIGDGSRATGVRLQFAASYAERPEGQSGYDIKQIVFHCLPTFNDAIAAFQRSEINTLNFVPADSLTEIAALPINPLPAYRPSLGAVIYNWRSDAVQFFRDLRMRQALVSAVNRDQLVAQYLPDRAIVANSPILPSSWAFNPQAQCLPFDPEKAKSDLGLVQLLPPTPAPTATDATPDPNASPVPPDSGGKIAFQVLTSNDPSLAPMAEAIVAQWKEILGLDVTLVVVDKSTFRERLVAGNFDSALVELNLEPLADPDPYSLWRQVPQDGGLNFGGLNDRLLSEIMESARREPNGIARAALYQRFQESFCSRAAAIPLFYPAYFYGVDRRLSGVQIGFMSDASDRFRTISDWKFVSNN
ncbi:MAG: peptide ABC transporter substrate-binding protein [Anaerolineae bacterium]|nr:peptide ABC transporter substrate-binding protein [Anaerolineae bacterium]